MKKLDFFTLAEILIVVGIIGVVAELTIPTLMEDVNTTARVTATKKAYSTLSQAYTSAVNDNGTPDNWELVAINDPGGAENIMNIMSPYLRLSKYCGRNTGCLGEITYYFYNNLPSQIFDDNPAFAKGQLADGSLIMAYSYGDCDHYSMGSTAALASVCGYFQIDINGIKKPNQFGKDLFVFWLTKNGIVPIGTQQETSTFNSYCDDSSSIIAGMGCTAWVIYNGNEDYLKCPGTLSWGGKTSCN